MANAKRDENAVPTLIGVSSADGITPIRVSVNPINGRLLVDLAGGGSGTVTGVLIATANGFAGTSDANPATPTITLSTTVTGLVKGNGTSFSAATAGTDYVTASSTNTFTNKTYDTAGAGNAFAINGTAITAVTGTGAVVLATSPTLVTPALGTPASGTLTNTTGFPTANLAGAGAGVLTFLATPSSANLRTAVTDETGSGVLVFGTSPDFTTGITIGGVAVPTISSTSTLTNKTLTAPIISTISNTGTLTLPTITDTLMGRTTTDTLTNKRVTRRSATTNAPGATPTTNSDNVDVQIFTGLATAITSMTTNLSGTPVAGDFLEFWLTDNGTARAITWGASFAATTVALPTTTQISTKLRVLFEWGASTWDCVAVA